MLDLVFGGSGLCPLFFFVVTIIKSDVEKQIIEVAELGLAVLGMRVVDIDCVLVGHRLVRLFVEKVSSNTASIQDCSEASELVGKLLEQMKLPSPYDLEVSSPGLDRRLRTERDFESAVGSNIMVCLATPIQGRANVSGVMTRCISGMIEIAFDATLLSVPIGVIKKANVVWKEQKHAV